MAKEKITQIKAADTSESKPASVIGRFEGKCCDANVFNNNDMHLGPQVFKKLFASDEYKRAMQNRHYIGFLGHPADSDCQEFEHACIVMTDCKMDSNNEVFGTFDLVDTPVGRVVKAFTDVGVKFGISIRGVGDVDNNGEVDPDQFIFRGFDLVTFPAYDDCIPEFKEIAASTDTAKQAKYKKICASIDANLKDITSCEALEVIKEQLPDGSDEFNKVEERIAELTTEPLDEVAELVCDPAVEAEVAAQKLEAMTQLYLAAMDRVRNLESELATCQVAKNDLVIECSSLKQHQTNLERITANQIATSRNMVKSANSKLADVRASLATARQNARTADEKCQNAIVAKTELEKKLQALTEKRRGDLEGIKAAEDLNLKYQHKIESSSRAISQKDSEIEKLKKQLDETVTASQQLKINASNLDDTNKELLSRVEAAEEMVSNYQQAYANLYANALGVYLTGLPVTASTSVDELKQMIQAGTSTANIPAKPSYYTEGIEEEEDEYIQGEGDFDDDTQYSADLVTL